MSFAYLRLEKLNAIKKFEICYSLKQNKIAFLKYQKTNLEKKIFFDIQWNPSKTELLKDGNPSMTERNLATDDFPM